MADAAHCWIRHNKPFGQILVAHTANAGELFAAEELARYFEKISGVALPVNKGLSNRALPAIILLDASRPANLRYLNELPLAELKHDGFIIKTCGKDLFIVSKLCSGLVFGMYQYLTLVLGVRFYDFGPEGEDIPFHDTVEHAPVNILRTPRLPYRSLQETFDIRRIDWMIKNGFNYARINCPSLEMWDQESAPLVKELKKRGIRIAFAHHIFNKLITEERYLTDQPDYFPEIDGKHGRQAQFSWSLKNPEVIEEVIFILKEFLARHPEIDMFDFWPADGLYKVDSGDFRAFTGEPLPEHGAWEKDAFGASATARLGNPNKAKIYTLLIKPVAEALARCFPNLIISTLHYADLVQSCPTIQLPPNVMPIIAVYWRCIKHGLLEENCLYNRSFKQALTEWCRQYPDRPVCLYEYYMGMGCHVSLPYPCLTSLFEEWDELIKLGIGGAHIQSSDHHAVPYNINYLAFAELAWDNPPSLDTFLKNYCKGFFGEAHEYLYRMYQLWEQGCQNAKTDTQPGFDSFGDMFPMAQVVQCRQLLDQAIQAARDPKVIYRIARLIILMEYARLVLAADEPHRIRQETKRQGKSTEAVDKQLLPLLHPLMRFVRRLKELGQDIFQATRGADDFQRVGQQIKKDVIARKEGDRWEKLLAEITQQPGAMNEFNPDIIEAELARKNKRDRK